jgi:hypothetical protein
MTGTGRIVARLRVRRHRAASTAPRTGRELLATLGRLVLWVAVGLVLVRGVGAMTAREPVPAPRAVDDVQTGAGWPDDAARAFAVEFATAYLTYDRTGDARELEAFASPQLVAQLAPQRDSDERQAAMVVRSAAVADAMRLDGRRALITVTATLTGAVSVRRRVTVPVARDSRGGLVVYDLPSFASAPARASVGAPETEPLIGAEQDEIADVLVPFLRAYLAGDSPALTYLVPPGTRMPAAAGRWELIDLTSLSALASASATQRTVLATVQARDERLNTSYALRYRVRVVRRDRWYVAEVNGPGRRRR